MPRPKNPAWKVGKVAIRDPHPTKGTDYVQARGYYNDGNGRPREVTTAVSKMTETSGRRRSADSLQSAAVSALEKKVKTAEREHRGGDSALNNGTAVGKAAEVWLDYCARQRSGRRPLAASTLEQYAGNVSRYVKGSTVEHLTLAEVNDIARIESWLEGIADNNGEGAAKAARKVLSGVLSLAERRGAIPVSVMHRVETPGAQVGSTGDRKCTDPECDYECDKRHLNTRRAFTQAEAVAVQAAADASQADIGDLAAFLFGTGARLSEALLCVRWDDVSLDAVGESGEPAPYVRINGTKTQHSRRTVLLSPELADRLRARGDLYGRTGLVFGVTRFPTKAGQPRDKRNVGRSLRLVFAKVGVPWAGSHTFRRTVATWLHRDGASLDEVANQLGHGDVSVTGGYLDRATAPTRAATVMRLNKPQLHAVSSG